MGSAPTQLMKNCAINSGGKVAQGPQQRYRQNKVCSRLYMKLCANIPRECPASNTVSGTRCPSGSWTFQMVFWADASLQIIGDWLPWCSREFMLRVGAPLGMGAVSTTAFAMSRTGDGPNLAYSIAHQMRWTVLNIIVLVLVCWILRAGPWEYCQSNAI